MPAENHSGREREGGKAEAREGQGDASETGTVGAGKRSLPKRGGLDGQ